MYRDRSIAFPFEPLAEHLAVAPDRFGLLTDPACRGFFVGSAPFHFPEGALALHLFLEHPQRGIYVVVAHEDLHGRTPLQRLVFRPDGRGKRGAERIGLPSSPARLAAD